MTPKTKKVLKWILIILVAVVWVAKKIVTCDGSGGNSTEKVLVVTTHPNLSNEVGVQTQTQIRDCNAVAKWDGIKKVWNDPKGEFITPPNVYVWRTDTAPFGWRSPFDEWAELYPNVSDQIRARYAGKPLVFLNEQNIVRRYGQIAVPRR
jgi:hypothetical protein